MHFFLLVNLGIACIYWPISQLAFCELFSFSPHSPMIVFLFTFEWVSILIFYTTGCEYKYLSFTIRKLKNQTPSANVNQQPLQINPSLPTNFRKHRKVSICVANSLACQMHDTLLPDGRRVNMISNRPLVAWVQPHGLSEHRQYPRHITPLTSCAFQNISS